MALSVATNYFSYQFENLYYDGYFTRDELVNMAALRSKIPTIQALTNIIEYTRPHKMCIDLKEEIRIQGKISSGIQLGNQAENDMKNYENQISEKCNKILQRMKEKNKNDPEYCTTVHSYFMGHDPLTCLHCKHHVMKNVRGSRGETRRGSINYSDFVQDYYSRNQIIDTIKNVYSCQCCYRHQINMPDISHISDIEKPHGDIYVYPNTKYQKKLPQKYHCLCDCKCMEVIFELAGYVEDLDSYRSYSYGYDKWNDYCDEY